MVALWGIEAMQHESAYQDGLCDEAGWSNLPKQIPVSHHAWSA